MVAKVYHCQKCSKPNNTNQTTCKNCGADLEQILDGSKHKEKTKGASPTLILGIIAVVILGVIAFITLPLFIKLDGRYSLSSVRVVGSAISATIQAEHSDFLINGTTYTLDDVLSATVFPRGIAYQATDTETPASGKVASNVAGTAIIFNHKHQGIFKWDYTPRKGDTLAYITENADSFPLIMSDM